MHVQHVWRQQQAATRCICVCVCVCVHMCVWVWVCTRVQEGGCPDGDAQDVQYSTTVLQLYYSPLRTALPDGDTGLLAEAPRLLVRGRVGGWGVNVWDLLSEYVGRRWWWLICMRLFTVKERKKRQTA